MYKTKNRLCIKLVVTSILIISIITGCSNLNKMDKSQENNSNKNKDSKVVEVNTPSESTNYSKDTTSIKEDPSKELLLTIIELAKKGKVINSEFSAKTTGIEEVEEKLGKSEKIDWIPNAKGMYATYPKYNIVFGFNKGSQIFEVRSFDSKIKKIPLSKVKEVFGNPKYDAKVKGEEIIGYVVNEHFKILLVFPEPTKENTDPLLEHYSVFYPQGTVNSMADDPGREW